MLQADQIVTHEASYYVSTRAHNGHPLFHHDPDFHSYLNLLAKHTKAHRVKIFHFVLMPNHVDLVLRVDDHEALTKALRATNLTYALLYQKRYHFVGTLWQGAFKNLRIDDDSTVLECGRYIELQPFSTGLVRDLSAYPWSSYRVYAEGVVNPLLARHPVYDLLGTSPAVRQHRYRQAIHDRCTPAATHDNGNVALSYEPGAGCRVGG